VSDPSAIIAAAIYDRDGAYDLSWRDEYQEVRSYYEDLAEHAVTALEAEGYTIAKLIPVGYWPIWTGAGVTDWPVYRILPEEDPL
jgi:hypothetical protein